MQPKLYGNKEIDSPSTNPQVPIQHFHHNQTQKIQPQVQNPILTGSNENSAIKDIMIHQPQFVQD